MSSEGQSVIWKRRSLVGPFVRLSHSAADNFESNFYAHIDEQLGGQGH